MTKQNFLSLLEIAYKRNILTLGQAVTRTGKCVKVQPNSEWSCFQLASLPWDSSAFHFTLKSATLDWSRRWNRTRLSIIINRLWSCFRITLYLKIGIYYGLSNPPSLGMFHCPIGKHLMFRFKRLTLPLGEGNLDLRFIPYYRVQSNNKANK